MNLLELRKQMKRERPSFVRQDFHKKRLRKRWVKPRGLHSKVRLRRSGHPMKVSSGYGYPREVRGLSKEGLKIRRINNERELDSVEKEKEGIVISSTISLKNKILLLKKAKEKGIRVLNLNADEYLKTKEDEIKKRLEKKKVKEEKKEKKKEEKKEKKEKLEEKLSEEEKKEKKEKLEEKLSEEEKKEKEKEEKDKLLIKREV